MMQLYTRKEDQVTAAVCGTPDWAQQYDAIVVGAGSVCSKKNKDKQIMVAVAVRMCSNKHEQ